MKFNKRHQKQLNEFIEKMDKDGCLTVNEWTSGSGRFTSNKVLPPFVTRFERKEYKPTELPKKGTPERTAYWFFKENPKRKAVLVLDKEAMMNFFFENALGKEM